MKPEEEVAKFIADLPAHIRPRDVIEEARMEYAYFAGQAKWIAELRKAHIAKLEQMAEMAKGQP